MRALRWCVLVGLIGCSAPREREAPLALADEQRARPREEEQEILEPITRPMDEGTPPPDADAGPCEPCLPSILTTAVRPSALTAANGVLYWIDDPTGSGLVQGLDVTDKVATPSTIAKGQTGATAIAADDTRVFWTGGPSATVSSAPRAGGSRTVISTQRSAVSIAVDGSKIVFGTSDGAVFEVAKVGGATSALVSGGTTAMIGVSMDASRYFWLANASSPGATLTTPLPAPVAIGTSPGTLFARPRTGLTIPQSLESAIGAASAMTGDADAIFVAERGSAANADGRVLRIEKANGVMTVIANGQRDVSGIAVDETWVYWTSAAGGKVLRAQKSGAGSAETLAADLDGPTTIVTDPVLPRAVFWVVRGAVMTVSR